MQYLLPALFSTIGSQDGCDRVRACVELNL